MFILFDKTCLTNTTYNSKNKKMWNLMDTDPQIKALAKEITMDTTGPIRKCEKIFTIINIITLNKVLSLPTHTKGAIAVKKPC